MKKPDPAWEALHRQYFALRHYGDEYKAYEKEGWLALTRTLYRTFSLLYRVDLETGATEPRDDVPAAQWEQIGEELKKRQQALRPLHDPAEDQILLWPEGNMPLHGFTPEEWQQVSHDGEAFRPHLVPFLHRDGQRRPTVLITGGSFRCHATEGFPAAEYYYRHGYNAFVLNNRHAMGEKVRHTWNRALDLQRAVRLVRANAAQWGIDENAVVFHGFSMGNRGMIDLINDLGVTTCPSKLDSHYRPDAVDALPSRPDAWVAVYPALFPFDDHTRYEDMPPTFFVMGDKDWSLWRMVPFAAGMATHGVETEWHLFHGADHGFGMDAGPEGWSDLLWRWLQGYFGG